LVGSGEPKPDEMDLTEQRQDDIDHWKSQRNDVERAYE
jgi:hypothetical protein